MDPSTHNFGFYGAEHNAINDDDQLAEMFLFLLQIEYTYDEATEIERIPQRTLALQGTAFVKEVLVGHPGTCYELFRMQRDTFVSLVTVLRANYLEDTWALSVEE